MFPLFYCLGGELVFFGIYVHFVLLCLFCLFVLFYFFAVVIFYVFIFVSDSSYQRERTSFVACII